MGRSSETSTVAAAALVWALALGEAEAQPVRFADDEAFAPYERAPVLTLEGHRASGVADAAFSPDRGWVATASGDRTVRVWRVGPEGRVAQTLVLRGVGRVESVDWSSDMRWLAAASEQELRLWRVHLGPSVTAELVGRVASRRAATFSGLRFRPDGETLVTSTREGELELWSFPPARSRALRRRAVHHGSGGPLLALSRDGRWAVVGGRGARLWDLEAGRVAGSLRYERGWVGAAAFSPNGAWLVTGWTWRGRGAAGLWEIRGGTARPAARVEHGRPPEGRSASLRRGVERVGFVADGAQVVTATGRTARVWRRTPSGLEPLREVEFGERWHDRLVAGDLSRGPPVVVTSHSVPAPRRLDTRTGDLEAPYVRGYEWPSDRPPGVVAAPSGRLAVTLGRTTRLYALDLDDTPESSACAELPTPGASTLCAAFSPDGALLAVGTSRREAQVWDVRAPSEPRRLLSIRRRRGELTGIAFVGTDALVTASRRAEAHVGSLSGRRRARHLGRVSVPGQPDDVDLAVQALEGRRVQVSGAGALRRFAVDEDGVRPLLGWTTARPTVGFPIDASRSGRRMVLVSHAGPRVYATDPGCFRAVADLGRPAAAAAISGGGGWLAVAADERIELARVDAADGRPRRVAALDAPGATRWTVPVFLAGGAWLAARTGRETHLWRVFGERTVEVGGEPVRWGRSAEPPARRAELAVALDRRASEAGATARLTVTNHGRGACHALRGELELSHADAHLGSARRIYLGTVAPGATVSRTVELPPLDGLRVTRVTFQDQWGAAPAPLAPDGPPADDPGSPSRAGAGSASAATRACPRSGRARTTSTPARAQSPSRASPAKAPGRRPTFQRPATASGAPGRAATGRVAWTRPLSAVARSKAAWRVRTSRSQVWPGASWSPARGAGGGAPAVEAGALRADPAGAGSAEGAGSGRSAARPA